MKKDAVFDLDQHNQEAQDTSKLTYSTSDLGQYYQVIKEITSNKWKEAKRALKRSSL